MSDSVIPEASEHDQITDYESVDRSSDAGETEHGQETPQVNWDDPSNPYLNRFKGLQGTVQSYAEELKALRERQNASEYQNFMQQLQDLPEDEQRLRLGIYQANHVLSQREKEVNALFGKVAAAGRAIAIHDIASQYKVAPEELANFDSPEAMEQYAKGIQAARKSEAKEQRRAAGSDRFEGGSAPSTAPTKRPKTLEEARAKFASRRLR